MAVCYALVSAHVYSADKEREGVNAMRNKSTILAIVIASSASCWRAGAAESGWYVVADLGRSSFSGHVLFPGDELFTSQFSSSNSAITYKNEGTGYRLVGGYQFNRYVGIELSDVNLGEESATTQAIAVPSSGDCGPACESSYELESKYKARGWALTFTGALPIGEQWAVYGRLGYLQSHTDFDSTTTPTDNPPYGNTGVPPGEERNSDGFRSTYGLGVKWSFSGPWAARMEWDKYKNFGDGHQTPVFGVTLISLGIEYRF